MVSIFINQSRLLKQSSNKRSPRKNVNGLDIIVSESYTVYRSVIATIFYRMVDSVALRSDYADA